MRVRECVCRVCRVVLCRVRCVRAYHVHLAAEEGEDLLECGLLELRVGLRRGRGELDVDPFPLDQHRHALQKLRLDKALEPVSTTRHDTRHVSTRTRNTQHAHYNV